MPFGARARTRDNALRLPALFLDGASLRKLTGRTTDQGLETRTSIVEKVLHKPKLILYKTASRGGGAGLWPRVGSITLREKEVCTMETLVYWLIDLLEGFVPLISVGMEG